MKKQFVDIDWLWKFYNKEGVRAYNSLVKSNNVISNGTIMRIQVEIPNNIKIPNQKIVIKK